MRPKRIIRKADGASSLGSPSATLSENAGASTYGDGSVCGAGRLDLEIFIPHPCSKKGFDAGALLKPSGYIAHEFSLPAWQKDLTFLDAVERC